MSMHACNTPQLQLQMCGQRNEDFLWTDLCVVPIVAHDHLRRHVGRRAHLPSERSAVRTSSDSVTLKVSMACAVCNASDYFSHCALPQDTEGLLTPVFAEEFVSCLL